MYQQDRKWSDIFLAQVLSILGSLMAKLAVLSVASEEKDKSCATDFELKLTGGTIAVRLRRANCKFRDLTIRAARSNGVKTELAKIKDGHASRYFYGWTNEQSKINEWVLVDLDKVRTAGLLDKQRDMKPNRDGTTSFIRIPLKELHEAGCILAYRIYVTKVPRHRGGLPEGGYFKQWEARDKAS